MNPYAPLRAATWRRRNIFPGQRLQSPNLGGGWGSWERAAPARDGRAAGAPFEQASSQTSAWKRTSPTGALPGRSR